MKKTASTIVALFIVCTMTFGIEKEKPAESSNMTTSVSGKVFDRESGESLAGVAIKLSGTDQTVYSDFEGNFEFSNIKPGTYKIESDLISYKQDIKEIRVDLKSDNTIELKLENL